MEEKPLEAAYKALQKQLHPDKFGTASPEEQEHAQEYAALVNEAYHTLRNPHIRAEYLLRQHGVEIGEGAQSITDAALIMEVSATLAIGLHHPILFACVRWR